MKFQLVVLNWVDANSRDDWMEFHELEDSGVVHAVTTGWLINEAKTHYTVCHTFTEDSGYTGEFTIPKQWAKIKKLNVWSTNFTKKWDV